MFAKFEEEKRSFSRWCTQNITKGYFAIREYSLEKDMIKNCVLFVFLKCKKGVFSKNVLETLKIGVFPAL